MGAVLTFLTGQDALDALAALADEAEKGRSVYWKDELESFFCSGRRKCFRLGGPW